MIGLGIRLALAGGRDAIARLALIAVAVGPPILAAGDGRRADRTGT